MLEPIPFAGYIEVDDEKSTPVAWWNDTGDLIELNISGRGIPLYMHPIKTLTDEEIAQVASEYFLSKYIPSEFARALIKKVQEK